METRNARPTDHYRNIPVVNLLASGQPAALRVFGAEGRQLWVRAALAGVAVVAGVLLLLFVGQDQNNVDARAASLRQAATADDTIVEAQELESEIAELLEVGDVSLRDFEFLLGDPRSIVGTIRSVFDLDIAGVVVTNVEMLGPDSVSVEVVVDSNSGAIQWRSRLADMPGVQPVLSFDLVQGEDGQLTYRATLVAGGSR